MEVKHLFDYKPFSKGRMAIILSIYEETYKFKRIPKTERGEVYSPEWKALIVARKEEMGWDNCELMTFMDLVKNYTRKVVRQYLLENGSKIVRRGKRTYVRGKRK